MGMILKNSHKGFVYSLFAFMALVIVVGMVSVTTNSDFDKNVNVNIDEKLRTDELFYFRDGAEQDFKRSSYISGRRAVIALVNDVVNSGNYTSGNASDVLESLVGYGVHDNTSFGIMENSTVEDWSSSIYDLGQLHSIFVSIDIVDISLEYDSAFFLNLSTSVNLYVRDLIFGISFNDSVHCENILELEIIEDSLVSIGSYGYIRQLIKPCNVSMYPYHARMISNSTVFGYSHADSWTSGRLSLDIDDASPSSKILVISDIPGTANNASSFLGVVSENASDDSSGISNYIFGASSVVSNLSLLNLAPIIVMDGGEVWSSYIYDELNESCYFLDELGPSILDRFEGNLQTSQKYNTTNETIGIASFIRVLNLPEELQNPYSSVDFRYIDCVGGKKIKGVTESEPEEDFVLGFLLDDEHILLWNLTGLEYS